jgi:Raf kinase inhibitor-like YbhB/YbcL family protein
MFVQRNFLFAAILGGLVFSACSKESNSTGSQIAKLQVTSTAFSAGQTIPQKYTCSGDDVSPPLTWTLPPAGTKSVAVIVQDADAPGGVFTHWVIFDLPSDTVRLDENVPKMETLPSGAKQGINDFKKIGYSGPCPPPGKPHHYHFKIYALDMQLNLTASVSGKDLLAAMNGHVLAEGELTGTFGR